MFSTCIVFSRRKQRKLCVFITVGVFRYQFFCISEIINLLSFHGSSKNRKLPVTVYTVVVDIRKIWSPWCVWSKTPRTYKCSKRLNLIKLNIYLQKINYGIFYYLTYWYVCFRSANSFCCSFFLLLHMTALPCLVQVAAILSCFVCSEKSNDMPKLTDVLSGPLRSMQDMARKIARYHTLIVLKLLSITKFANSSLKFLNLTFIQLCFFILFRRHSWLIIYFFAFFTAMCATFSKVYCQGFL